jgi:predicted peptidase
MFANLLAGCASPRSTPQNSSTEEVISPTSSPTDEPILTVPPSVATDLATEPATELGTVSANNNGQHPFSSDKAKRNYLLFLPAAYGNDPAQKWPLILFLHGSGTRGNNIENLMYEALPQILGFTPDFPFIVLSPQLTNDSGEDYWTRETVVASLFVLLEEIQEKYSVDPERIYLTGVSIGGNGVWEIGLSYPDRFAALVPVMGFYGDTASVEVPDNICDLKDVPIWAFHGAKDHIVPLWVEEDLVDALKACGGNAQITVYPDGDHDISGQAYENQDLYAWLLSQSLK